MINDAMTRFTRVLLTAVAVVTLTVRSDAQQCCLPNVGECPESARLVEGIGAATLVLGATPFVLVAGIALWMRNECRRDDV
jgi:hypothetical protein